MIKLHYAYPTSTNGGFLGSYYTDESPRRDYGTINDALNDIAKRHGEGTSVEFCFGDSERADPYRQFGWPCRVTSAMDSQRKRV